MIDVRGVQDQCKIFDLHPNWVELRGLAVLLSSCRPLATAQFLTQQPITRPRAGTKLGSSECKFHLLLYDYALSRWPRLRCAWSEVARLSVSLWPRPPRDKALLLPGENPRPAGILPSPTGAVQGWEWRGEVKRVWRQLRLNLCAP